MSLQGRDAEQVLRRTYRTTTALSAAAAVAATTLAPSIALALPQDGTVVEGQAEIIYGSNSVEIVQGSDRVIIEWSSFDVGVDESVNFVQPSQLASALNRVLSGQSSAILGSLTGNGQITIVNPAGIHFGATANVDVAAITATTIDIINANFMANNLAFDQFNDDFANATVTNDGSITVQDSGLAALVAPGVANNGIIAARTGAVVLASGTAFTVDPYGDGLIQFAVNAPTMEAPEGMDALVSNSGEIYADGGTVILTAEAVSGIVDNVVNMDGVIQAQTIEGRNGQIALVGGSGAGAVNVAGTLDASGNDAGEAGGTVHVLGDQVALNVGANVDVSGAAGGGEALIGGAARGGAQAAGAALQYQETAQGLNIISDTAFETDGYTPTSDVALVMDGADLDARATVDGDGGQVIVWGTDEAYFHGAVDASGAGNGDGGFVEISGAYVYADGSALAGGPGGTVLIDPDDACIAAVIASCAFTSPVGVSFFTTAFVAAQLAVGNFVLSTTGGGAGDGDIEIGDDLNVTPAAGATLSLTANDDIWVDGDIIASGANGLNLDFVLTSGAGGIPKSAAIFLPGTVTDLNGGDATFTGTPFADSLLRVEGSITAGSLAANVEEVRLQQDINVARENLSGTATLVEVQSDSASIQDAIDLVSGSTINVAAGTYNEALIVDEHVTIIGAGSGDNPLVDTIVDGTGLGDVAALVAISASGVSDADRLELMNLRVQNAEHTNLGTNAGTGIKMVAGGTDFITFDNVVSTGHAGHGFAYDANSLSTGVELIDVTSSNNAGYGFRVPTSLAGLTDFSILGGEFADNGGAGFGANPSGFDSAANIRPFTNVLIDGTAFAGNNTSGIGGLGDIVILGVDGDVTIQNVTIDSDTFPASRGLWFDFHGDATLNMDNVAFSGVPSSWGMIITNFDGADALNMNDVSFDTVVQTAGRADFTVWGAASTGPVDLGNTAFLTDPGSGPASDQWIGLVSGATSNVDASDAVFNGVVGSAHTRDAMPSGFFLEDRVTHALDDGSLGLVTWVADNVFVTQASGSIQRGVDAASAGWTVNVDDGTFVENVLIDKSLDLLGANAGTDPNTAARDPETEIDGVVRVDAGVSGVAIDGFTIIDGAPVLGEFGGVYVNNNAADVTIANNIFARSGGFGTARAILFSGAAPGVSNIDILNNSFSGWATGVYVNPNADDVLISGNVFDGNNVGVSNDGPNSPGGVTIDGNTFANSAFEALGLGGPGTRTITNNVFENNPVHIGTYGAAGLPDVATLQADGNTFDRHVTSDLDDAGSARDAATSIYGEIQLAIDESAAGATVTASDGTFVENVVIDKALMLLSENGRDFTTIEGISGVGALGTVLLPGGVDDVQIGDIDQGFTIVGIDNGAPGIETAAVYLQGNHNNFDLIGNDVVAMGDAGLLGESAGALTNALIDNNIFSGQTFEGPEPADNGFSNQFSTPNVPRQLVTLGEGNSGPFVSNNIAFTNNQVTGTAGGSNGGGEQGNTLVTIDADMVTVSGNTFSGFTARFASQLRTRGPNTDIVNNTFIVPAGVATAGLFVSGVDSTVIANTFTGGTIGISTNPKGAIAIENNVFDGQTGAALNVGADAAFLTVFNNSFEPAGGAFAVFNSSAEIVNASGNWWGTNDETLVAAMMSGDVDFTPFLDVADDTDVADGFQGDFTTLHATVLGAQTDAATYGRIQEAIDLVTASTVILGAGTFIDPAQVVIDKDVTIIGQGSGTGPGDSIVNPGFDTGSGGNARGWWLILDDVEVDLSDFRMDGNGQLVWQAIRHLGRGSIDNLAFNNIQFNASGPSYQGTAVAVFGATDANVDITNSTFDQIGRIGVLYFGSAVTGTFANNVYTGKGDGDHLDYALDISAGATINVFNNTVTENRGVASSDGSISAAFLVSTFFAGGTSAVFGGNTMTGNTVGIAVGFDDADTSTVQFLNAGDSVDSHIMAGANTFMDSGNEDETGIFFSGNSQTIVGDTFADAVFNGYGDLDDLYIQLRNQALSDPANVRVLDATDVTFTGASATEIEDRVEHYLDDPTKDLIFFGPTITVADSIQLAVNAAEQARSDGFVVDEIMVGPGTYGGRVEIWVDDLKITGDDAIIDLDMEDPFSNNPSPDALPNHGFLIGDAGVVGDGVSGDGVTGSYANGLDVSGVEIDPFTFTNSNDGSGTGIIVGLSAGPSVASNTVIDGNSFEDIEVGIAFNNVAGTTTISNNTILADLIGLTFEGTLGGGAIVDILDNTIGADGDEVLNGILFQRIDTAEVTISGGSIDSGAGAGPILGDAINFQRGLHSGADVEISGVTAVSDGDEPVDFHQAIRAGATATISGGSYTGGNNGVEFSGAIAGTAIIENATIVGQGADKRGVNLLGSITGLLDISGSTITGGDDGIGSNDSAANTVVGGTVRLTDNTITGISGHGVSFDAISDGADLEFLGNTVAAALNGLSFNGAVTGSLINIGNNNNSGRNIITADNSGIVFAGSILDSADGNGIRIRRNTVTAGPSAGDRGIEFRDGIEDSFVRVSNNRIGAGDDGVAFYDLNGGANGSGVRAIAGTSDVALSGNRIGTAGDPVGAEGLDFDEIIDTATVVVRENVVFADGDGMQFDRVINTTGSTNAAPAGGAPTYTGGVVIVGNEINAAGHGALFDTTIDGTDIAFGDNDFGSDADPVGGDGVQFKTIAGDALISFERTHIEADGDGVSVVGGILDTATLAFDAPRDPAGGPDGRDNDIDAGGIAVNVVNLQSPGTLVFSGGVYSGAAGSVLVDNTGVASAAVGRVVFENDPTFNADPGVDVAAFVTEAGGPGIEIDFSGASGATFNGGENGIVFDGPGIDIAGDSLGDIAVNGQADQYLVLRNGAEFAPGMPNLIDIQDVAFDGDEPGDLSPAGLVALESKLAHFLDTNEDGLFYYGPTYAVADGGSIQLAVNAAEHARFLLNDLNAVDTVLVGSGTYGGRVELWVDDLKLTGLDTGGGDPVIDLSFDDAFSNNPFPTSLAHGFLVGDAGIVGDGVAGDSVGGAFGSHANGNDVTGVEVDPFTFDGTGALGGPPSTGIVVGLTASGISPASVAYDTVIDGNTFHDLDFGITSNNSSGETRIVNNTMHDIAVNAVRFEDAVEGGEFVLIRNNDMASGQHVLLFRDLITGADTLLRIRGNWLVSTGGGTQSDGIAFGQAIQDEADVRIVENHEIRGTEGIDVDRVDNANLRINRNTLIVGEIEEGIEFDDLIANDARVAVRDNVDIIGATHGIAFVDNGAIDGATVNISGNNDGILGQNGNGILFNRAITDGRINIGAGNIIEGITGSGVRFAATIADSRIDIFENTSIVGDANGVEFTQTFGAGNVLNILANTLIEGDGSADDSDAIDFRNAVGGTVNIVGNVELAGNDDGLQVIHGIIGGTFLVHGNQSIVGRDGEGIAILSNDGNVPPAPTVAISGGAVVTIDDNMIVGNEETDPVLQNPGGGGDGVLVSGDVVGATLNVTNNTIFAFNDGTNVFGAFVDAQAFLDDNTIHAGLGADGNGDGIHVEGAVDDSRIQAVRNTIEVGLNTVAGGTLHDGLYFGGDILGTSRVILRRNDIMVLTGPAGGATSFGDMGIRFDGFIDTNGGNLADVLIRNNDIQAGGGKEDRGISFWNGIGGSSFVEISRNDIAAGDDGVGVFDTIGGSQQQSVRGDALLLIAENNIGTDTLSVGNASPNDGNGIDFQRVTGESRVVIDSNSIFARYNGIEFDKLVDTSFAGPGAGVAIIRNSDIVSDRENAIAFEAGVDGSSVNIARNALILGALNGIKFGGPVDNGALVRIWNNHHIIGEDENGILFNGIAGFDTDVWIGLNHLIRGYDNGIYFARDVIAPDDDSDLEQLLAGFLPEGWAIDGASANVVLNHRIIGETENGILAEGIRGDASNPDENLLVALNKRIRGEENGIWLAHGVDYTATDGPLTLFGSLFSFALDMWAIDNGQVAILNNLSILGDTADGVRVDGVLDSDEIDRTELAINGNLAVIGAENGVNLRHGVSLDVFGEYEFGPTDAITLSDGPALSALTLPASFELEVFGVAAAIYGAEVEIAYNALLHGHEDNGVAVHGIVDMPTFPEESTEPESTDSEALSELTLASLGSFESLDYGTDWNLDLHDNLVVVGGTNGAMIDHGYRLFLQAEGGAFAATVTELASFESLGSDIYFQAWLDAWAIYGGHARIADNWALYGQYGDGVRVNGVRSEGVVAESASGEAPEVDPVSTSPDWANLLIEDNTTVVGARDGIHLGNGHVVHYENMPAFEVVDLTARGLSSDSFGLVDISEFGVSGSVFGGLVVIDSNGDARYQNDPNDPGDDPDVDDPYDPAIPVILSDLDFGRGLMDMRGRVAGIHDDGIDVAGSIDYSATVQIQRNMITGSGDNGVEFGNIGGPALADDVDPDAGELVGIFDYGPSNVFVHNNFIVDNGQRLLEETPEEEETELEVTAVSFPSLEVSSRLTGAGILFEEGVGNDGLAEVYQNYIAGNGGPGVQIGFDSSGTPTTATLVFESDDDFEPDFNTGPVAADNLRIVHNYLPGFEDEGVDPDDPGDDRPNGSFAIDNNSTVGGLLFAEENWLGSADPGVVPSFIDGAVDFFPFLETGEDSNEERAPGLTGLSPFAFQPGEIVVLATEDVIDLDFLAVALLLFIAGQTDPDLVPGDELSGRSQNDATNAFDDEFADPYPLGLETDLAALAPAAGQACALDNSSGTVAIVCGAGGETDLADLAPAAGSGTPLADPSQVFQGYDNFWAPFQ